jgi:hypothetical protein
MGAHPFLKGYWIEKQDIEPQIVFSYFLEKMPCLSLKTMHTVT